MKVSTREEPYNCSNNGCSEEKQFKSNHNMIDIILDEEAVVKSLLFSAV
jgi:hypothetical protein